MSFIRLITISSLFFNLSACSFAGSKLQTILDRQIGKTKIIEKTRLELDSILGKKDSRLKSSILDFVSDRVEVNYTDILIDGKKARVRVVANVPKLDELGTLILLASFLPREKMLDMTIQDVLTEISKNLRRPANHTDIVNETYEFNVDFEKGKEYWIANTEQLSRAFNKQNLITKR